MMDGGHGFQQGNRDSGEAISSLYGIQGVDDLCGERVFDEQTVG